METTVSPSGGRVERAVWLAEGFAFSQIVAGQDNHVCVGVEGERNVQKFTF